MAPLRSYQACSSAEDLQTSRAEPSFYAHRAKKRRKYSVWNLATWNVRSLLDAEGPLETAKCRDEAGEAEGRRVDQVILELERYNIAVAGLQETRWYGEGV